MKSSTRFLASSRPTQPISGASAAMPIRRHIDHRRYLDRILLAPRHPRGRSVTDRGADADIAGGEMLRPGQRLGHQPAMLDQRRAQVEAFERGVDICHVLTRHDRVVTRHDAGAIGDRRVERQVIRGGIDLHPDRGQLRVRLVGHPRLVEAGDDVDRVTRRIERLREQPYLRLLAAHDQPGEDEQDAHRGLRHGR